MKIAALAARILLGLAFTFFGIAGLFNLFHQPAMPGLAGQYLGALAQSHMVLAPSAVELATGLLLLSGFYVPLALTLLGPVLAHILLFHVFFAPAGIGPGLATFALWLVVFWSVRGSFAGIFEARA